MKQLSIPSAFILAFALVGFSGINSPGFAIAEVTPFECSEAYSAERPEAVLKAVESRYASFSTLRADFEQESYFIGLGERVQSTGTVRFKKPGMMDWQYKTPDEQRFIADGRTLWFYQPELNQVTVGSFKSSFSSELPVSFLLGIGKLSENFSLAEVCRSDAGLVLKLRPVSREGAESDPNLDDFFLLVDAETKVPQGARIIDVGGNETSITFNNIDLKIELADKEFNFDIPRGVDVIDRREAGAAVVNPGA